MKTMCNFEKLNRKLKNGAKKINIQKKIFKKYS
jgi:hypothetical protein